MLVVDHGGINWCWYSWYERIDTNTLRHVKSDRYHRFREDEAEHPKADYSADTVFTAPTPRIIEAFGERAVKDWQRSLERHGFADDTRAIFWAYAPDGTTTIFRVID